MPDLSTIDKLFFPKEFLHEAYDFFREAGSKGYEAVSLFAGKAENNNYHITHLYIPVQESYQTREGLMYRVSAEELNSIDDWLFDSRLSLICQMHTHPGEAYHSHADDMNCIVTSVGGLSIVVPDFAMGQIDPLQWAIYRLVKNDGWIRLSQHNVSNLIHLV